MTSISPPTHATKSSPFETILVLSCATAVFAIVALLFLKNGLFDDSYITFQYARNFANGAGLVWDRAGPPIEGFTSVAWVVLLGAATRAANASVPSVATALGLAFGGLTLWLSWLVLRRLGGPRSWVDYCLPIHLALTPELVRQALSGMETLMVAAVLLALAVYWSYAASRYGSARYWALLGLLSFLTTLARPDAAVFALAGSVWLLWRLRASTTSRASFAACFSVPAALSELARRQYFGEWLPLPAHMKLRPAVLLQPHLLNFILGHWLGYFSLIVTCVLVLGIAILLGGKLNALGAAILVSASAYGAYFLSVLPIMSIHYRFLMPTYACFVILGVWALGRLVASVTTASTKGLTVAICAAFVLQHIGHFPIIKAESESWANGHEIYGELGRRLRPIRGIKIACSEVGELAWYADSGIVDLSGLNDPFIAKGRFADDSFASSFARHIALDPPDVYVEPPSEYTYAQFSNLRTLAGRYDRVYFGRIAIDVLRSSRFRQQLATALATGEQ